MLVPIASRPAPSALDRPPHPYLPQDESSWSILHAQYRTRLLTNACESFVEGYFALGLDNGRIESVEAVDRRLKKVCGWRLEVVNGLLPHGDFVYLLRDRVFPVNWQLRPLHSLHFTEIPDLFHDVMGHLPLLVNPVYAAFLAEFGALSVEHLNSPRASDWLSRLYWYAVETGLVRERDGDKVLGTAIVTSQSEWMNAFAPATPRQAFDLQRIFDQPIDESHVQQQYFVLPSFDRLHTLIAEARQLLRRQIEPSFTVGAE